jgi:hypothetical protein
MDPNYRAGGNIGTSLFVTPFAEFTVVQSVAGDSPIGISGEGPNQPQIFNNNAYAASTGDQVQVYGLGKQCLLTAGPGGWSEGQYLKPNNAGQGVPVNVTSNDAYGARALTNANAGETARVLVVFGAGS